MPIRRFLLCAALAVGACAHEQPFETADTATDRPFLPGTPARLTYNPGSDLRPAWLPDGSAFLYAWQQYGPPDFDRCLGQVSARGGTRTRTICNTNPASVDSADLFDAPALSEDGRLLFLRTSSRPGAVAPDESGFYVGSLSDPLAATRVLQFPYAIPGGRTHTRFSNARWISRTRVVYLGESVGYTKDCSQCPLDTLVSGVELVDMDLSGPQPSLSVVPSSFGATSAALSAERDTLYFTLMGDTRVHRMALANGDLSIAHDFAARGIVRDVTILGARLVAVVGGEVYVTDDPLVGPIQLDGGGDLVSVDLATGAETLLPTPSPIRFRRPAFAPRGSPVRLVVEGYPPTASTDTTRHALVSKVGELYLYEAP